MFFKLALHSKTKKNDQELWSWWRQSADAREELAVVRGPVGSNLPGGPRHILR